MAPSLGYPKGPIWARGRSSNYPPAPSVLVRRESEGCPRGESKPRSTHPSRCPWAVSSIDETAGQAACKRRIASSHHLRECFGDSPIAVRGCMLVAHRCARCGVAEPSHELRERCTGLSRKHGARVTQVVEVEVGPFGCG